MTQLDLFPADAVAGTRALLTNFGGDDEIYSIRCLAAMRKAGICAEIYPDAAKMKKQMAYADRNGIPFVVLAGETERTTDTLTVKNMATGEQQTMSLPQAIEAIGK